MHVKMCEVGGFALASRIVDRGDYNSECVQKEYGQDGQAVRYFPGYPVSQGAGVWVDRGQPILT